LPGRNRPPTAYTLAFAFALATGFVLRALGVPFKGTFDMDFFSTWGNDVYRDGLAKAYQPTPDSYFPAAYQIFGVAARLARTFDLTMFTALKTVNLVFDTGTLLVLIALLRHWRLPIVHALIYWLNPYFIVTSWLGYADFLPGFFVLLSLLLVARARTILAVGVAGLPLGIAAAMKPQPILLVAMLGGFVLVSTIRTRAFVNDVNGQVVRAAVLMVGSAVVFAGYWLFFVISGKSGSFLVRSYLEVGDDARAPFTGNMPNIWYPVADFYAERRQAIADVFEPKIFHTIAAVLTVAVLAYVVMRIVRRSNEKPFARNVLLLFVAGVAILPMLMTRAHENHFFLAGALGVLVVAVMRDWLLTALFNVLLALQGLNMVGFYGIGENRRSLQFDVRFGIAVYAYEEPWLQTVLACVTVAIFAAAVYRLALAKTQRTV